MTDRELRINKYKERQELKKKRFAELAKKHIDQADLRYEAFKAIGDRIPPGQPILVGHHSERGHRADLKRMDNHMRKLSEHLSASKHYEKKIERLESNKNLITDDPELLEKVSDRLAGLLALRDAYKAFNKTMKTKGIDEAINQWPGDKSKITRTIESYKNICEKSEKLPSFILTNLNAKIRRYQNKKDWVENLSANEPKGFKIGPIDVEFTDGYWLVKFPSIPSNETRTRLKKSPLALKWSRSKSAWVRRHTPSCGQYFIQELKITIQKYIDESNSTNATQEKIN